MKTATVTRFEKDADQEARKQFAADLVAALDEADVQPGESFVVMLEEVHEELVDRTDEAKREREEAEAERDDALTAADNLREMVDDFRLGLVDKDELIDRAKDVQYHWD